jgi:hypothetical protein
MVALSFAAKSPNCRMVNLLDDWERLQPGWDQFVRRHPKGSIFHTSQMMRVFQSARGHRPLALAAVADDGEILSLLAAARVQTLPNVFGAVSSRSIWYAEPLCYNVPESIDSLRMLIAEHDRLVRHRVLFAEVRPLHAPGPEQSALEQCGYRGLETARNASIDYTNSFDLRMAAPMCPWLIAAFSTQRIAFSNRRT